MFVDLKFHTACYTPDELLLESGQKLGSITIAYETWGTLNPQKSNAILICHALSGDSHVTGRLKDNPRYSGWWSEYVGPGKTIDTNKYFVICSNTLGGCKGSTGPNFINPKTGKEYGLTFPVITIEDMVKAQKVLIDHLGIVKLKAVIGGSMGGMQSLEWAIMYPYAIEGAIVLAATARLSPQALAFDAVGRNAIITDPAWNNGAYYKAKKQPDKGLATARMIGHITYLSNESMDIKFGRKLQKKADYSYDFETDFEVESYLKHQGDKFVGRFDANSYLCITKAISYFDLAKKYGSLDKAFKNVMAKFLIISISTDWLYPPYQSKEMVKSLMKQGKEVTYYECQSPYGHDAFLIKNEEMFAIINNFIEKL